MIDVRLATHASLQLARLALALGILALLPVWGRWLGTALGCRLLRDRERLLVDAGLGFGLLSAVLRLLGSVGLFRPALVWAVAVGGAVLLVLLGERPPRPAWRGTGDPSGRAPRTLLVVLALLPLPLALAPAVSWDALAYHLRTPERALVTGFWEADPFNLPTSFPAAHGTLYGLALSLDPQGVSAQLVSWGFHLGCLAALLLLGERLADEATGRAAAILYAAIPAAGVVASFSWADPPLVFALLASLVALGAGSAPAALALLGLAAAVKYTGLLFAVPVFVASVAVARRDGSLRALVAGAVAGASFALPWYLANGLRTGNPFYPFLSSLFGGPSSAGERILHWETGGSGASALGFLPSLWRSSTVDGDLGGPLVASILGAGLLGAVMTRRLRRAGALAAACALALIPFSPAPRVVLPLEAGLLLLACVALLPRVNGTPAGRRAVTVVLLLVAARGGALVAGHAALFFRPLPAAIGVEPERAYVQRNFPALALFERARALPPDAFVLSVGEPRLFRFPRGAWSGTWSDDTTPLRYFLGAPGTGPDGALTRLHGAGVSHILLSDAIATRARGGADVRVNGGALDALLSASRVVDREGGLTLWALPGGAGGRESPPSNVGADSLVPPSSPAPARE